MDSLLVGIDVSKELFSVAGIDSEGNESFSRSYCMDSSGFDEFIKTITSHCEDLSEVIVAMESTGCYHINLYSFLTSGGGDKATDQFMSEHEAGGFRNPQTD
jgi:transposase